MRQKTFQGMDVLSHFMAPLGVKFSVFICGDDIGSDYEKEIIKSFNRIKTWDIKDFEHGDLVSGKISYVKLTTSELFRGKLAEMADFETDIVCLDAELSKKILHRIAGQYYELDDVDNMLINKYIINSGCDRYIFDLTGIDRKVLSSVFRSMDYNLDGFNYVVSEKSMGVCAVGLTEYIDF